MAKKDPSGPGIFISSYNTAVIYMQAKEVGYVARCVLALAANFRHYGANLYKLCNNEAIERMLCLSHGQFMRAKKQLKDAGLLDYTGSPGDYSHLVKRWERISGYEWEYEV